MQEAGRVLADARLGPLHVSLYLALCQLRAMEGEPVQIHARKLMNAAKIGGNTPFYRTIRELAEFGYIVYKPSHDPARRSEVWMRAGVTVAGENGKRPQT